MFTLEKPGALVETGKAVAVTVSRSGDGLEGNWHQGKITLTAPASHHRLKGENALYTDTDLALLLWKGSDDLKEGPERCFMEVPCFQYIRNPLASNTLFLLDYAV